MASSISNFKRFQIRDYFLKTHGYKLVILQDSRHKPINDETWLINNEHPKYKMIRISDYSSNINDNLENYRDIIQKQFKLDDNSVLLVYVGSDSEAEEGEYDSVFIDYNYASGSDVSSYFADLDKVVADVKNEDDAKSLLKNRVKDITKKIQSKFFVTYTLIGICFVVHVLSTLLARSYDHAAVEILLGADYKTFTVGLRQVYRLVTYAFVHGSWLHLMMNMVSLYNIGRLVEFRIGHIKYLAVILFSALIGGLSSEILTSNSIMLGMSGAIYGLMVFFIMDALKFKALNMYSLYYVIIINICLNFMSSVAWLTHLGGLIGGLVLYLVIESEDKRGPILLTLVLVFTLSMKFLQIEKINPIYAGTDNKVVEILTDMKLPKLASRLSYDLYNVYIKYGR